MSDILATISRDAEGYLLKLTDWNQQIANAIASKENITLTKEHWLIINILRDFYQEYHTSPTIRVLLKLLNTKIDKKIDSIYLHQLFPNGPAKQANKIAGLPKPIRCI